MNYETSHFVVRESRGRLFGEEKEHPALTNERLVLVEELGGDMEASISSAFEKTGASATFRESDQVAIKVNLGGGIRHIPATQSDPAICEAIIKAVKCLGGRPMVCEANMRAQVMNEKLLRDRGYLDMLRRHDVPFVNLSQGATVTMHCRGLDMPLLLPEVLLRPGVKIISFAPPKHHWECGITCNQKNMYGAIAEFRKSIYHRQYTRIDKVIAAASRIMSPDLSILGALDLGAGLGPHFCSSVPFRRIIVSKDMIRGDKAAAEILGYPFSAVEYCMINTDRKDVDYDLHADSRWPDEELLGKIRHRALTPRQVRLWKRLLYLQYFVPHSIQRSTYPKLEFLATWVNRRFISG